MQYTTEELQTILDLHQKWLYNEEEGKRADLRGANMSLADMRGTNLRGADLSGADLRGANMSGTDLRGADMSGANMSLADMRGTDLRGADMSLADMRGTDMRGSYLSGAKNIPEIACARLTIVPESGSFIGYKKAYTETNSIVAHPVIVKLEIAADAKRSNGTGRKCRCSKAKVISITDAMGETFDTAYSTYEKSFMYTVGETVEVADFDENRWDECAPGIQFFITRAEAENY